MRKFFPLFAVIVLFVILALAYRPSKKFKYDVIMSSVKSSCVTDQRKNLELLNNAVSLEPSRPDAYAYRASAYIMLGFYNSANTDLSILNKQNPSRPVFYFTAASAYCYQGDYAKAMEYLQKTADRLKLRSDFLFFGVKYSAAVIRFRQGRYEDALKNLEGLDEAVQASPELLSSVNNMRAQVLFAQKKYKEAMAFSDQAVKNVKAKLASAPDTPREDAMCLLCKGKIKAYSFDDVFKVNEMIKAKLPPSKPAAKPAAKPAQKPAPKPAAKPAAQPASPAK